MTLDFIIMNNELVKFETAKLAKEKGFNIPTRILYEYALTTQIDPETNEPKGAFGWKEGECKLVDQYMINNHKDVDFSNDDWYLCSAPTQAVLQRWLREVHNINVFLSFKPNIKKWDFIPYYMTMTGKEYIKYNAEYYKLHIGRMYNTYEEALEEGLIEALKLINI